MVMAASCCKEAFLQHRNIGQSIRKDGGSTNMSVVEDNLLVAEKYLIPGYKLIF